MIIRLIVIAAALSIVACSDEHMAPLVAADVEISPARPGTSMRAAYLTLQNNTGTPIQITSAASPDFDRVEFHESIVENDIARMRPVAVLIIEPNAELVLERGGLHLMLMRPADGAATRERIRLDFFDGDRLVISVSVRQEDQ